MFKKIAIVLTMIIAGSLPSIAELRVSRRSNYTGKFMVMRHLVKLSSSESEAVAVEAMNSLREVLFRSENLLVAETAKSASEVSPADMVNRMNYDVDKIHQAIFNLENAIQVANLEDANDRAFLKSIKLLIVDEIKQILSSGIFLDYHEQLALNIQKDLATLQSNTSMQPGQRKRNHQVFENLQKLLDLAWYIYAEQSQWLMATAFRLECLKIDQLDMKSPMFLAPELNHTVPPRMYVPGSVEDYTLECCSK